MLNPSERRMGQTDWCRVEWGRQIQRLATVIRNDRGNSALIKNDLRDRSRRQTMDSLL